VKHYFKKNIKQSKKLIGEKEYKRLKGILLNSSLDDKIRENNKLYNRVRRLRDLTKKLLEKTK
jgi:hypothetical protein